MRSENADDCSVIDACRLVGPVGACARGTDAVPRLDKGLTFRAVRSLHDQGIAATAEWVAVMAELIANEAVDVGATRVALEELADERRLGRLQNAPYRHDHGSGPDTAYVPVDAG